MKPLETRAEQNALLQEIADLDALHQDLSEAYAQRTKAAQHWQQRAIHERDTLAAQVAELEAQPQRDEGAEHALVAEIANLNIRYRELQMHHHRVTQRDGLLAQIAQLESWLQTAQKDSEAVAAEVAELQNTLATLQTQQRSLKGHAHYLIGRRDALTTQVAALETELSDLRSAQQQPLPDYAELECQVKALEERRDQLLEQTTTLTRQKKLEAEREALAAEITVLAAQQIKCPGCHKPFRPKPGQKACSRACKQRVRARRRREERR
jgi:chromosome segregation ATPase